MIDSPARPRRVRFAPAVLAVAFLASCLHAPSVAPTASLTPGGAGTGGPRTGSAFAVAYAGPRGEITDRRDPAITVLFNRAMRDLESPDDRGLPSVEVRTKEGALIAGRLRWVGTRGLIFVPDRELPGATRFVVTVAGDTKSLDGAALGAPYTFELQTPRPAIVRAFPAKEGSPLTPDARIFLVANQELDKDSLAKATHFAVRRADGAPAEPVTFRILAAPELDKFVSPTERRYQIKPEKPLPLDVGVELTVDAGVRGGEGPLTMDKPFSLKARTYGPLRLASFHCPRIASEGRCKAHNDLKLTFTNPVTPEEVRAHLRAPGLLAKPRPKAKGQQKPQTDFAHWIGADPQLGKKYKVTLTAGMKDVFGQALAKDTTFEIEVEAPFSGGKGSKGAAPAPAAPPREEREEKEPVANVPHRAQLAYELRLGLAGSVVEALATSGTKSHKLPLASVNIPTYKLAASRLAEAQALAWLAGTNAADFLTKNHIEPEWISPAAPENTRAVRNVDLDVLLGKTARGAALVAYEVPGEGMKQSLVRVTDLGITIKASRYGSLVWVTSLATGKPVQNANVSVRTPDKGEIVALRTDDRGMVMIPADRYNPFGDPKKQGNAPTPPAFVFASAGDDWTYQRFERSATDARVASGFQDFGTRAEMAGMIYTDRGIYRPGETVKVAGLFRAIDAAAMRSPAGDEVRIEAKDGHDEAIFTTRVPLDRFGAFVADIHVPKSAHLGDASVTATLRGKGHNAEVTERFHLGAYKASEFKVEVDADAKEYVRGDDALFSAKGSYLFGGPMVNVKAHTTIERQYGYFEVPGASGFVTQDEAGTSDAKEVNQRVVDLGASDETLDAEGRASRRLKLVMPGQSTTEQVRFEIEVEDLSRQTVAQHVTRLVHPAEFYLGLKRPKERFVSAGGSVRADLLAFEPSGAHRAGVAVKVELFSRKWIGAVAEREGRAHQTSSMVDTLVGGCDVRTEADARGCDLKVPEAGYFVMRASAQDPRGNKVRVSQSFYAVEDAPKAGAPPIAWAASDTRGVRLEANKKHYDPGDTARFLVQSPFREAEALVTVERHGVLFRKVVHISGPMPTIEVPVTPEMYPNAYVAVHLVRGRIAAPPEKGADLGGPEFRMGYEKIEVNQEAHRLSVEVAPAKKEVRPGDEVDVDLTVLDRDKKPIESELTFYAVDEGVLMLTSYKTPDPLPHFAQSRPLAVYTAESREDLAHLIPLKAGERVPILGYEYAANGDKGNPGGGGGGMIRADFRSTAYFEAGKVTNKEGKARVHFKLPDNLTTFRLMAVAASESDFFGAGEAKITTSKKLMARPALPRILRVGDAFEASVVVSSKELPDADVEVSLDARGVELVGDRVKRAKVSKGGSVEVRFPITATAPGEAVFELAVKGGGEGDKVRVTRKVELPLGLERVAAYGEVRDAAAVALGDLSGIRGDQGSLEVHVAPTALVGLSTSMESLVDYPYGCTEQLASRALPLAVLSDLAKDFGAHLPANVPHAVEEAVDGIVKHQREDGGFGFWEDSDRSEPWLSAYVLFTLDAAKKAGNPVPSSALDAAVAYVRDTLRKTKLSEDDPTPRDDGDEAPEPDPNRSALLPEEVMRLDYANAAFMADALASIGAPDPGYLTRLYDARRGKPLAARALLLHAMAAAKMSNELFANLIKEIEAELVIDANQATARANDDLVGRALYDSAARTTALVLRGVVAADKKHPLAPRLARGLLALRENGAWRSTQENGWALLALRDYRAAQEASGKDVEARAFLGGDLLASRVFAGTQDAELKATVPAAQVAKTGGPVTFQVVGDGQLFYSAELRYATAKLPKEARDRGLFVKKVVRAVQPEELADAVEWLPKKSGDVAPAGSLVLVDLLLESSEDRKQVVIDDPLPAGLEAIDTALDTASRSRSVRDDDGRKHKEKERPGALTGIGAAFRTARVHREFHDDRVLTFIEDLPPGMYHFRYLTRATSIGRFVVPPTRVEAMYTPEVWGSTAAGSFEVKAKP
jgi:hypothetical protein